MKILTYVAFAIGGVFLLLSIYNQFVITPEVNSCNASTELTGDYMRCHGIESEQRAYGEFAILGGGVALILGLIAAFKTKEQLAWIAVAVGAAAAFWGAALGTHMLS